MTKYNTNCIGMDIQYTYTRWLFKMTRVPHSILGNTNYFVALFLKRLRTTTFNIIY